MSIIEITPDVYDVDIGLTYATNQNFTGKPIYASSHCYLHQDAAKKLEKAIELVKQFDLRIRIFDCLRPTEAQWMLWRHTPDPDFLAHPANGSPHSRGVAIDLSLSDKSGKLLNMGTTFDEFTNLSHHGAINISLEAQRNRFFLLGIMTAAGWDFYNNEWWHYQLFDARNYPLIHDKDLEKSMMEN